MQMAFKRVLRGGILNERLLLAPNRTIIDIGRALLEVSRASCVVQLAVSRWAGASSTDKAVDFGEAAGKTNLSVME